MTTAGFYGGVAQTAGLYGTPTSTGANSIFEWFIFKVSSTQPATPTGGSWDFTTETGTPPSGWTTTPPVSPTTLVWLSIAIVNSAASSAITWSVPGQVAFAGPTSPITSTGDLIVGNGVNSATRLPIGANGYFLASNGTTAVWTQTLGISNGGTGQTTATAAFNALAPSQTSNSGKYLTTDGTNTSWATVSGGTGASLSNDTSTATNLYPLFANATTGTPTTIYTSNAKYLYKPSTGDLQASQIVATNGLVLNSSTISASYTIPAGQNAHSVGPITIASGQSVQVTSGQRWVVL